MTDYTNEQLSAAVEMTAAIIRKYPQLKSRAERALGIIRGRGVNLDTMTVNGSKELYALSWCGDMLDCNCWDMVNFQAPPIVGKDGQPVMMCKHILAARIAAKVTGYTLGPTATAGAAPPHEIQHGLFAGAHHTMFADGTAVPDELLRPHMEYMLIKGKPAHNHAALTGYIYQ